MVAGVAGGDQCCGGGGGHGGALHRAGKKEGGEVPEDQWLTRELREGSATAEKGRRRQNHPGERRRRRRTSRTIPSIPGHPGSNSTVRRERGMRRRRRCARLGSGFAGTTAAMTTAAADSEAETRMEATNPDFPRQFLVRG